MKLSEIYKVNFEKWCIELLNEAFNTSLNENIIQLNWEENDISQELFEKLDANPKRLKWNISASREFHLPNVNISKSKGYANKLRRIDIRMTSIISGLECKYFCEAKRLKEKDSKLKSAYIKEGMDRYISEKYPIGCMIGYLVEGDVTNTIDEGVNKLLNKYNRSAETLKMESHNLVKSYYESNHPEIGILKHLIFDFTNISN